MLDHVSYRRSTSWVPPPAKVVLDADDARDLVPVLVVRRGSGGLRAMDYGLCIAMSFMLVFSYVSGSVSNQRRHLRGSGLPVLVQSPQVSSLFFILCVCLSSKRGEKWCRVCFFGTRGGDTAGLYDDDAYTLVLRDTRCTTPHLFSKSAPAPLPSFRFLYWKPANCGGMLFVY